MSVSHELQPVLNKSRHSRSNAVAPSEWTGKLKAQPYYPSGRFRLLIPLAVAALTLIAFMPVLWAGLVDWDDDVILIKTQEFKALDLASIQWMFTSLSFGHYQPLTWFSYALDFLMWKGAPMGYHLTNLLLHILTALAFYDLTRQLLSLSSFSYEAIRSVSITASAGVAAILFACHPLRVESVAWLAERRDVLSGFFFVLSVGFYVRYAGAAGLIGGASAGASVSTRANYFLVFQFFKESIRLLFGKTVRAKACGSEHNNAESTSRFRVWVFYVLSVVCCGLSLSAKAVGMTLWVVLFIFDVYPLRRTVKRPLRESSTGSWTEPPRELPVKSLKARRVDGNRLSRVVLEKLPYWVMGLAAAIVGLEAQQSSGSMRSLEHHDWLIRVMQAGYGLVFYVWKTLVPTGLGPLYQLPSEDGVFLAPRFVLSVVLVLGIMAALWVYRKRMPGLVAASALYVVVLSPVLGFAQSGPQLAADRYSYLPCLGFAVLGGWVWLWLIRSKVDVSKNRRFLVNGLTGLVMVVLVLATNLQTRVWANPISLWVHGVWVSPNSSIAHANLGMAFARAGRLDEAEPAYLRALALDSDDEVALHHLGDLYRVSGSPFKAIESYRRVIKVNPYRRDLHRSLAELLIQLEQYAEALVVLRDGSGKHPGDLPLIEMLADMLATHPDETIRNGREAIRWAGYVCAAEDFAYPSSLMTLASAYAEVGQFDEAIGIAERALKIAQDNQEQQVAEELMRRLDYFRQDKPYRFGG